MFKIESQMKAKLTIFIAIIALSISNVFAQNEQDLQSLSIFSEYVKSKNYEAAYSPWMELRNRNPRFNKAIFVYGERILKHKIKTTTGAEQVHRHHSHSCQSCPAKSRIRSRPPSCIPSNCSGRLAIITYAGAVG